jgi:hypothetical protein
VPVGCADPKVIRHGRCGHFHAPLYISTVCV